MFVSGNEPVGGHIVKTQLAAFALALALAGTAGAGPITITSYNISDAIVSGFGGWGHTYSGTITPTGHTMEGSDVAAYTGGSGTLNDGVLGTSPTTTQLFDYGPFDGGVGSANPVITLFLSGSSTINSISIFGGNFTDNGIPGCMTGVTVGLGGGSAAIATTAFGAVGTCGVPVNDLVTITGTSLAGLPTATIVLSNFTGPLYAGSDFSITEIQIDGTPVDAGVPEPASAALIGGGLAALALIRRRK